MLEWISGYILDIIAMNQKIIKEHPNEIPKVINIHSLSKYYSTILFIVLKEYYIIIFHLF